MDTKRKRKCYKVMTLIGANIILLTSAIFMYWGNIAPYVLSYYMAGHSSYSDLESPWTISLNLSFLSLGMLIYSFTAKVIGGRWTAVLGILATDASILATFFAVKSSFFSLNITLGIVMGFGVGLTQGYVMDVIVQWSNTDVGTLVSLSKVLYLLDPLIINQMMTAYINPDNLVANLKIGKFDYYTQVDILDKVPYSFIVLGCLSIPCHIIGILMIRSDTLVDKSVKDSNTQNNGSLKDNSIPDTREGYGTNSSTEKDLSLKESFASTSSETKPEGISNEMGSPSTNDAPISTNSYSDYAPREVVKCISFYAMWTSFFLAEIPFIVLFNYYKLFGQLWIHDDHFLTNLGSVMSLANVLMGICWGLAIDRFGVKKCLMVGMTTVVMLSSWYFFIPNVGRWLYFFLTNLYVGMAGVLYGSFANVAIVLFGKKHFPANYALIRSSTIILNLIAPTFIEYILHSFGWFYVFASAGISCFLSLILVICFLPYDGDVSKKKL